MCRVQVATHWICSCVTLGTTRTTRFSVMTRSNGDEAAESIPDKRRGSVKQNKSEGRWGVVGNNILHFKQQNAHGRLSARIIQNTLENEVPN